MSQIRWLYQIARHEIIGLKLIEDIMGEYSPDIILKLTNQIDPNDLITVNLIIDLNFENLMKTSNMNGLMHTIYNK